MYLAKTRLAALALALAVVFGGLGAGTALAMQTHMANARMYLNYALRNLEQATPDKAGHREKAMNLIGDALQQVDLGIKAGAM